MSIYLYSQQTTGDKQTFRLIKPVNVSGNKSGIFPKYFKKYVNKEGHKPIIWEAACSDFIEKLDELKIGNELIMDMPPRKTDASLLLLQSLWAYTASTWTIFLIKAKEIRIDGYNRQGFEIGEQQRGKDLFTFWYMGGGYEMTHERKYWAFQSTNPTHSAFLNKEVLNYFMKILGGELKREEDPVGTVRHGFEAMGYV